MNHIWFISPYMANTNIFCNKLYIFSLFLSWCLTHLKYVARIASIQMQDRQEGTRLAVTGAYTQRFFILLEILKSETDEEHRMSGTDLTSALSQRGMSADRRTVQHALQDMQKAGCPIVFDHGWYYQHTFSAAELDLMILLLGNGTYLEEEERQNLLRKLKSLGGSHYAPPADVSGNRPRNPEMLMTVHTLNTAIHMGLQVTFHYGSWSDDRQLHVRYNAAGYPKKYTAHPYALAAVNGRIYLLAAVNRHAEISHYRLDRMMDVHVRRARVRPLGSIQGCEKGLDLSSYIAQHPYMYAGPAGRFQIPVRSRAWNDLYDFFGLDVECTETESGRQLALVTAEEKGLLRWLRRYAEDIEGEIRPTSEYRVRHTTGTNNTSGGKT